MYGRRALQTAVALRRLILSGQVDIVHTFFPASDLLGAAVAKAARRPIVISSRRDMGYRRSRLHRLAYRMGRGLYDQVHAVAEEVRREHIREDGLDPRKVVTVYNGIDVTTIDAARPERPSDILPGAECPVVVSVGNIRPVKGFENLVRTAAIVCETMPDVKFLIIGAFQDAACLKSIENLARSLNVEKNIVFAGRRARVPSILKTCDVFYLPSHSEGLSNALLEATACGLPCVATDVGGNGEVVEQGRSGYLVPRNEPRAAADRIVALLRDKRLTVEMGRAGRRIAETKFSMDGMVNRITDLYDGLLAASEIRAAEWSSESLPSCTDVQPGH
jgi:glycosyltransferase involved in cell wall biosynthesis